MTPPAGAVRPGSVDQLPSSAYRVGVYAGSDPVTGRRHDLTEIVPPSPRAAAEAEKVRTRLLGQVDERRNPRTKATLSQRRAAALPRRVQRSPAPDRSPDIIRAPVRRAVPAARVPAARSVDPSAGFTGSPARSTVQCGGAGSR